MEMLKLTLVGLSLLLASGCGVDKLLIERGVNKVDKDVVKELNRFAKLSDEQRKVAEQIGRDAERWVKSDILPRAAGLIGEMANDVESTGRLSKVTYDALVEFSYRPARFSSQEALITDVAQLLFEMTPAQDQQSAEQLIENHEERQKKRDKRDLEDQKDGIARGLRIIFRGMGVPRSREQLKTMRSLLDNRIDLGPQTNAFYNKTNALFVELAQNKPSSFEPFLTQYRDAWTLVEDGPDSEYPEDFAFNADNGFEAIDYLFSTLTPEEQDKAVRVLQDYQTFLLDLSRTP